MKKRVVSFLAVGALATMILGSSAVYATQSQSNYEILCSMTNQGIVDAGRNHGKRLGTIAKEAGKLAEFQQQTLANKEKRLAEKVAAGQMTQQQATQVVETIQQNQATCDGSGPSGDPGVGAGLGNGSGQGLHDGSGSGSQKGRNAGSCVISN